MRQALLLAFAVWAALAPAQSPYRVGSRVENFTATDTATASPRRLSEAFQGAPPAVVVMFIATQCPYSNAYNARMAAIERDYRSRGVRFVALNSNRTEPTAEVARHAARNHFGFPVLKDEGNQVADRFGAQVTPEVFVLDRDGVVRYHGRIDDRVGWNILARRKVESWLGRDPDADPAPDPASESGVSHDLRAALDAVLSGRAVPNPETKAFGCTIKRVRK